MMKRVTRKMKSLNGIFISPTEPDLERIWAACAREGLAPDSEGALKLILIAVELSENDDLGDDEEDGAPELPDPISQAAAYLRDNPEKVAKAMDTGMAALGKLFQGLRKPK